MAKIIGYIATSLDGFIATADDGLDWLYKYETMDLGEHDYRLFLQRIRTVVMGRATYDYMAADAGPWPYDAQRTIVVTSRPISEPKGRIEVRSDIDALISELRSLDDGDVWMLGGGELQMAFMQRGALDEIEIYMIPEIIGGGRPLFPAKGLTMSPRLLSAKAFDAGCVRLHYALN